MAHPHAQELEAISEWLDATPDTVEHVYADIKGKGVDPNNGRVWA